MAVTYPKSYGDVLGSRGALTESECWELEKILRRVGHFAVIDALAEWIDPHVADTEATGYLVRRDYARMIRREAGKLPDVNY